MAVAAWGMARRLALFLVCMGGIFAVLQQGAWARGFSAFSADDNPAEVFPGADRFGPVEGTPPAAVAYKGDQPLGLIYATNDIGYSGKPIRVLVGLDKNAVIVGAKVIEHHEPILLVGIPEQRLFDFVTRYVGRTLEEKAPDKGAVDAISGATVTAIVINDGVIRTGIKVARAHRLAGFKAVSDAPKETVALIEPPFKPMDWQALLGDGSVRRLYLTNGDVDAAFLKVGVGSPEPFGRAGEPGAAFIDFHATLITPEIIGRNLLGVAEYDNLKEWLAPGQSAILLMANGDYSFRGTGFVRGGIFDRIKLVQDDTTVIFHDSHYRRLGSLNAGMPDFVEVGLYKIPDGTVFDPAKPWRIELLAQRPTGPIQKAYTSFSLSYSLPEHFLKRTAAVAEEKNELWMGIWRSRVLDIAILSLSLVVLTLIFFFQDILTKYPKLTDRVRVAFLVFTVVWIGGYAQAQLSVVNVFTFAGSLMGGGFRWDFFLLEPLIFILWCATAVALLFWGRGAYCGWLCPFGALQELISRLARKLKVPQYALKFGWHERLWAFKYILFLALFGLSLHSIAMAEVAAEVEPFKTVVLLHFAREWPFVLYALALLGAGIFVERAFCRYVCPLGAGLAIPGRVRMFEWLKRRRQCGFECSICSRQCMVQAIHPTGQINPNECLYCLGCQANYSNDSVCPPLVLRRTKREKRIIHALQAEKEAATDRSLGSSGES